MNFVELVYRAQIMMMYLDEKTTLETLSESEGPMMAYLAVKGAKVLSRLN